MKKIITIFLVILLCGCQTTNNHKVKTVKKTQDYQQLSKYEIIDFKIIDHNLIFVYKKNNQTYVYDYSIEKNKELLNTMIFDGPVNKAKIHVLQDIYAIQLTDTLFLFQNHKLKNHIDLNNFFDEFEYDSLAISSSGQFISCVKMNYDTESILLLDRNSRLVSTVLTLDDTPRKLNAIWELAFTNDKTLIYTGGTYLKQGQQTSGCYGVINIDHQTYSLYNSPQVTLSSFKDKSIIHNQDEGYGANKNKIAVYYDDGFNDLGLNYENSVNCYLSNGKIIITEKGSVDDWKPYIIFNNVKYDFNELDNILFAEYVDHQLFIIGKQNEKTTFIKREVTE